MVGNMNVSELEAARGTAHLLDSSDIGVSSFGGKQARDTGYARIRREVKNLEAAIRVWNERHNSLSLSSRLPPEILSTIFEFFSEAERKELIDGVFDDFKWIRISHVCRHWRCAALACPSLWSSVLLTHPSARELLHRSGAAPLTMWFKLEDPSDFGKVRLLLKHMSRVEEVGLYFQGYAWVWKGSLTTVLREIHASPCLKTCTISFKVAATGTLPGAFLSKGPQLKTLTLQRCMLPSNCPEFPSLTSLSILSTSDSFPSLREFNDILNKFRVLERLTIDFENSLDLFENAESPAILPYLRELRIHTTLNNCSALLRNIIFPIKTSVRVSPYTFGVDSPISSFGKILCRRIAPIICLEVTNESDSVYLRTWDQLGTYFRPPGSTSDLYLTMDIPNRPLGAEGPLTALSSLWLTLPLENIASLHIHHIQLQMCEWMDIFGRLGRLEHLRVDRNIGDRNELIAALSLNYRPALLPKLRCLVAEGWELLDDDAATMQLKLFLEERQTRGAVLQELHLRGCLTTAGTVAGFYPLAAMVDWDGSS